MENEKILTEKQIKQKEYYQKNKFKKKEYYQENKLAIKHYNKSKHYLKWLGVY